MADQLSDEGLSSLLTGDTSGSDELSKPHLGIVTPSGPVQKDLSKLVIGKVDSFINTILSFVAEEKFDIAIREMRFYQEHKNEMTVFRHRTERYFDHCEELIRAIQTKKNFPNFAKLPMSKQEEIHEMVHSHFEDLRRSLKRIQKVETDIKVEDVRSTVWVIKALVISILAISVIAVGGEIIRNMILPFKIFQQDTTELLTGSIEKVLSLIGF